MTNISKKRIHRLKIIKCFINLPEIELKIKEAAIIVKNIMHFPNCSFHIYGDLKQWREGGARISCCIKNW